MNILIVHNAYLYPGGEDRVVLAEKKLLESRGHSVVIYRKSNRKFFALGILSRIKFLFRDILYNPKVYRDIKEIIRAGRIQAVHVHNTFFMISPSVYKACRDSNVPVVQTLHNYRYFCAKGTFFRRGAVCEECFPSHIFMGVKHRCWRHSFVLSYFLTRLLRKMREENFFINSVSLFIAPSEFVRQKYVQGGLPEGRIIVKPHFMPEDPGCQEEKEPFAVFIGSLRDYKGIRTLIRAWQFIDFPLKVIGSGPLDRELKKMNRNSQIEFLGEMPHETSMGILKKARFIVVPSECYETFSLTTMEAFAVKTCILASDIGVFSSLIKNRENGLLFSAGDAEDLQDKIRELLTDDVSVKRYAEAGRKHYEDYLSMGMNYQQLMDIYRQAADASKGSFL